LHAAEVVSLKELSEREQKVLCYPRFEREEGEKRLKELKKLGVQALEFTGEKRVFGVPVLGKGCVGIVVIAYTASGRAALKIRRVDADRKGMFHEGEMLKTANNMDVGPKMLDISENFLLMQLVEGTHFPEWIETLEGKEAQSRVRRVLEDVLRQCYRLDEAGLDHGELSNASKHILVDACDQPFLVDFETSSTNRRVSNVTSVCQYLFLGSQIAAKVREKLRKIDEKELVKALRAYKRERTEENFEKILQKAELRN
jgi:putative serine/threonine protein kinase